ncbi:uncharacterized protein LOC141900367 [Tubulanus polymorphus]|uniref:uncharacterized protein LOC141900367 n=1 Tax=Tubulanus polymorphus TaxID=672921 RepID=UPI003DA3FE47
MPRRSRGHRSHHRTHHHARHHFTGGRRHGRHHHSGGGGLTFGGGSFQVAGCIGFCSVACVMFGVFLLFPGITLTALGYNRQSPWDDPFFNSSYNGYKVVGPILLFFGISVLVIGIILCIVTKKKMQAAQENSVGTLGATTVITGPAGPQPAYNPYGPPQPQQYPPTTQYQNSPYPPPDSAYPIPTDNTSATNGGLPFTVDPVHYPPPYNPAQNSYLPPGAPQPTAPSMAPPSYDDAVGTMK